MFKPLLSLVALLGTGLVAVSQTAWADNQIDKTIFTASQTPARPGVPSVTTTGVKIVGTVDFPTSFISVWAFNGSSWVYMPGTQLSIRFSPEDSLLYGKTVYRYFIDANANGAFPIKYLDVDFWSGTRWVKMSETKGVTGITGNDLVKKQF